jgi:hypothetical protein
MTAKYVYGVVSSDSGPPSTEGIGGAAVTTIDADGLAALVSDFAESEAALGREAIATHARVLEVALEAGTVLPMRFGVVMQDEDDVLHNLLAAHAGTLREQLAELAGKVELRLRATYEQDRLMREVAAANPEIARLSTALRGTPADATYYERIRLGELVAGAVAERRDHDAQTILAALSPLALAVRVADAEHDRVALSASFLVERNRMAEFDAAVDRVGEAHAGRLRFKYTGPLPPHSFVALGAEA